MWRVKRAVLAVERVRRWVAKWDWAAIGYTLLIEGAGAVGALALALLPLAIIYGKVDAAPNAVAYGWIGGIFGLGNVIGWWCYLGVWRRILRWAQTSERVVERLQGR